MTQRRISFDVIRSNTAENILNKNKAKTNQRLQRNVNYSSTLEPNRTTQMNTTKNRAKSSTGRLLVNAVNAVPLIGDHKTILEGSQTLELINKLETKESVHYHNREELLYIHTKKVELQSLLQTKSKLLIKEECLNHWNKSNALIQELKTLYIEESNKLNFLKNIKSEDKRRVKVLDSLVKNSKTRKTLAKDIDQKSSSWTSLIANTNRLLNVTHMFPKDEGLDLIIQETVKELKYLRFCCSHLVRIILQINIELMSSLIEYLPFDSISDICISCQNFNKFLVSEKIKPLDLVSFVASNQAKVATNKFLYYLYNQTNTSLESFLKNESLSLNNSIHKQLKLDEITSDYFSASSHSTALQQTRNNSNFNIKIQKDLKTVFNILIQSNQRILLKIIFGHQENADIKQTKSSGSRQKWFKVDDDSVEQQQRLCQEYDKLFWNKFWSEFNKMIDSSLCFANSGYTSIPISALYNQTKAILIINILENCIRDEELLLEAISSLESAQNNLLLRLALQKWSDNYIIISKQTVSTDKSSFTVSENEAESRIGTFIGITVMNAVEPLLAIKVKHSTESNVFEAVVDNLLNNTLNIFVAFVERKQSTALDHQLLVPFIALSVLDINNLNELLSNLDLKWINNLVKNLICIKKNALLKVKHHFYYESYKLILKNIPFKEYRKKLCPTNSHWMENMISILLEPINALLTRDQSFETNHLLSKLIDIFAKALLDCIYKDNKVFLKFSHSGANQFNKDIEVFWDWIVKTSLQSTNLNAVTQLKSISFSLINKDRTTPAIRHNRVSPAVSFIRINEMNNCSAIDHNIRTNDRNCISLFLCSGIFRFNT